MFTHLRKIAQHPLLIRANYTDEAVEDIAAKDADKKTPYDWSLALWYYLKAFSMRPTRKKSKKCYCFETSKVEDGLPASECTLQGDI